MAVLWADLARSHEILLLHPGSECVNYTATGEPSIHVFPKYMRGLHNGYPFDYWGV